MKGLANATDKTIEAMTKMAEKLGVPVKKREDATAAAGAKTEPRPAVPTPPLKDGRAETPEGIAEAMKAGALKAEKPAVSKELATDLMSRLSSSGITDKRAQANILAQVDAESAGRADRKENLNYTPEQLLKTFPKKFKDLGEAQAVVAQGQEAIGNKVYGGRMGNAENEGFLYRGRGLIQLTGKQNYEKFGKMLGVDLVKNPDLAADPEIAKQIAVAYFAEKQKAGVDLSDIKQVGKAVGYAGGDAETQKRAGLANVYLEDTKMAAPATAPTAASSAVPATAPATAPTAASSAVPAAAGNEKVGFLDRVLNRIAGQDTTAGASAAAPTAAPTSPKPVTVAVTEQDRKKAEPVAPVPRANGGVIPAVPGGVNVLAAEAGMNEAFVPLPDGKTIPVQIAGNEEQMGMMAAQLDRLDQLVRIMQTQVGVSERILKYAQ
jgi:putative chitinase